MTGLGAFAISVTVFSTLLSSAALAGQQSGTVITLHVRESDGLPYFVVSGSASGKPACATNSYWMIKNEASEAGKKQYALLLAAQLSGAQVVVYEANTCTRGRMAKMLSK